MPKARVSQVIDLFVGAVRTSVQCTHYDQRLTSRRNLLYSDPVALQKSRMQAQLSVRQGKLRILVTEKGISKTIREVAVGCIYACRSCQQQIRDNWGTGAGMVDVEVGGENEDGSRRWQRRCRVILLFTDLLWWRPSPLLDSFGDARHAVPKRERCSQVPRTATTSSVTPSTKLMCLLFNRC